MKTDDIRRKLLRGKTSWYEKNLEEAKKDVVTISRLEFLDAFSDVMASISSDPDVVNALAVVVAMVTGKIFDKGGKNDG